MATPALSALIAGGREALTGGGIKDVLGAAGEAAALDVSPGFRAATQLNANRNLLQNQAERIRIEDEEQKRQNRIIPLDDITKSLGPSASNEIATRLRREGLLVTGENGVSGVRFSEGQKRLAAMIDEPEEELEFHKLNISDVNSSIVRNQKAKEMKIDELVRKEMSKSGVKVPFGSDLFKEQEAGHRANIESGLLGANELVGFDQEDKLLQAKLQQFTAMQTELEDEIAQATQAKDPRGLLVEEARRISKEENVPLTQAMKLARERSTASDLSPARQQLEQLSDKVLADDLKSAREMIDKIQKGEQLFDSNGNPVDITEEDVVRLLEEKYPTEKDKKADKDIEEGLNFGSN